MLIRQGHWVFGIQIFKTFCFISLSFTRKKHNVLLLYYYPVKFLFRLLLVYTVRLNIAIGSSFLAKVLQGSYKTLRSRKKVRSSWNYLKS